MADERNSRRDLCRLRGRLLDLITVEHGLIRSKDSYLDAVSMQAQLGLVAAQ